MNLAILQIQNNFPSSPDLCSHVNFLSSIFPIKDHVFNNQDSVLLSLTVHIT